MPIRLALGAPSHLIIVVVALWNVHAIYNTIFGFIVKTQLRWGASVRILYCITFLFYAPLMARMTIFIGRGWVGRGSNSLGTLTIYMIHFCG